MYTGVDNNEAYQAIQEKVQTNKHNGYAVISPGSTLATGSYAVTVDSGTLDAADTLSVGAANDEVLFNGGVQSLSAATSVQIDSVSPSNGNEQYRYDTIWADSSGEVQITKGTAVEVADVESQNNLTRFERFKGTIPFPSTYPSVVIAVVVVSSDDASIGTDNLRDYRIPASESNDDTTTNTLTANESVTDPQSNTITDFVGDGLTTAANVLQANLGDGLDFASGAIQILDTIWDGTNIVADVNNQSVVTEKASIAERSLFAYLSSSQTVSDSSNTTVEFDVEMHDNLNAWDTGGFEFTAPADGSYLFYVHLALVPSGSFSGERSQVQLNGPTNRRDDERDVNKSGKFTQDILVVYDLSQGQTVNVEYFQESGGNVDVNASTAGDSYLTVSKVG